MKQIISVRELEVPEGVTLEVKGRCVRVKGPRGTFCTSQVSVSVRYLPPLAPRDSIPVNLYVRQQPNRK